VGTGGAAAADYDQPIVSCAETYFIIAEAQYRLGATAAAQTALAAGVACQEALWGIDIPVNTTLTGSALYNEIMTQKYIALFLNIETYNDYKRTCLPAITPITSDGVPGRLLYGRTERQTNPNIPAPDLQPARNDNDPNACPAVAAD
jgi:hypothetical protein